MIEVGKKYFIAIDEDSELAGDLQRSSASKDINCGRLLGKIEYLHAYGFLFKLERYPKVATLNIKWDILKFIYNEEDGG